MLTLKSNRNFMILIIAICFVPGCFFTILLGAGFFFAENISDIANSFIITLSINLIALICLLLIVFLKRPKYVFTEHSITIENKQPTCLKIADLKEIIYYRFKWWYCFILPFVSLPDGGSMKLHIYDKDNKKYLLGFFSYKEAIKIQKLYPTLMKIK